MGMPDRTLAEELAESRLYLRALESWMHVRVGGIDRTNREIDITKREIAFLEAVAARNA
jgi:hypothetical protein